jgi:hypothetical protein
MPTDTLAFWTEHNPIEAFAAVDAVLGKAVKCRLTGQFKGHPLLHIGYPADFDLSTVEPRLRRELDTIGWQFVTIHLTGLPILEAAGKDATFQDGLPAFVVPLAAAGFR